MSNHDERLARFLGRDPQIDPSAYIDPAAIVRGDATIGPLASLWPGCVVRADINFIRIGRATNLQDGVIVHLADDYGAVVGEFCTVGHGAIIHACEVEDECLIGMRATILDGARIGKGSIVGAGALVTQRVEIPPGSLVLGMPARVVRPLTDEERAGLRPQAEKYVAVAAAHRARLGQVAGQQNGANPPV